MRGMALVRLGAERAKSYSAGNVQLREVWSGSRLGKSTVRVDSNEALVWLRGWLVVE